MGRCTPGFFGVNGGNDGFTKLLLHCNGTDGSTTFTDSSATGHTVTVSGNAQIDTAQSKFGGASALFDGSGDRLNLPASEEHDFGTNTDFAVDYWFRPSALSVPRTHVAWNSARVLRTTAGGELALGVVAGGNSISGGSVSTNTWYHVALTRSGSDIKLFLDGSQVGSTYTDPIDFDVTTGLPCIGANSGGGTDAFAGWIDEFRISRGIARWTADFTPPVHAYF